MTNSLFGKTVLIAGGATGIGLALAKKAAEQGAHVLLVSRSKEKLAAGAAQIDGRVKTHVVDIGVEHEVAALAHSLEAVDHVVTTAADLTFKPFVQLADSEIQKMLGSKFWGPVYLARHFAGKISKSGSFTFYSGSAAYKAWSGASVVAALNAGLEGLSRTLSVELAPVRVNVVSPGVVDSSTWDFLQGEQRANTMVALGASLPAGRVGTAEELADAGLFFMENGFATGAVLQVDGGANA